MSAETIEAVAKELGISMTTKFVPWSRSRNAGEKQPSLNWLIELHKATRDHKEPGPVFLTTDYMAGSGHCPSYKQGRLSIDDDKAIKLECERGKPARFMASGVTTDMSSPDLQPKLADVLHSLASDSDVLDHSGFESWAGDLGYNVDIRKAETIYRACLDIALKLRNALGEDGLRKLREVCLDY